jgi:hypothetical protein
MSGDLKMTVERENWEQLAGSEPMFGIFDIDMDNFLQRTTQSTNDEDTVNTLADNLGLPPNLQQLVHKLQPQVCTVILSDGQTSL